MKILFQLSLFISFMYPSGNFGYETIKPDLSQINNSEVWYVHNRKASFNGVVYLDARPFDGLAWLKYFEFSNGIIEVDIKGTHKTGQSFVGVAFHAQNDSTFDAVYFRPFNFDEKAKLNNTVQYISEPTYDWSVLRSKFPEKYESKANPLPKPDEWFHARIEIYYPVVKVYVNNNEKPSLVVNQLSPYTDGYVGFWVGNGSDGWFKNLVIHPEDD